MTAPSVNCRDCAHHRVEHHIRPAIVQCSLLDGQIGCTTCKAFAVMSEWKFVSGQIRCPACRALNPIPRADSWRMGCCGLQSEAVIVPLGGLAGRQCEDYSPVPDAVPADPDASELRTSRPASQRSLF